MSAKEVVSKGHYLDECPESNNDYVIYEVYDEKKDITTLYVVGFREFDSDPYKHYELCKFYGKRITEDV